MSRRRRQPGLPDRPGILGHISHHAKGLSAVAIASVLGIAASFAFQVVSARYLAPADFGLLSAFFVIVNVAAIGSSALQNVVVVSTAANTESHRTDSWRVPLESIAIGLMGGVLVTAVAPWLSVALGTTPGVIIAAAGTVPVSFVLADALGLLQGAGRVTAAVWWSTVAQLARIALLLFVIVVGAGLVGTLSAVVMAAVITMFGAVWSARGIHRPRSIVTIDGLSILMLTVLFAWLTNSDVLFMRASGANDLAGFYASAAVLVKAGLLVPSTLSLYMLPRLVRRRHDTRMAFLGVGFTVAVSLATGLAMIVAFGLLGEAVVRLLYGEAYLPAADLLAPLALAYLPWMAAQGVLMRVTSLASRGAAAALLVAAVGQGAAFSLLAPQLSSILVVIAGTGTAVLVAFILIDVLTARRRSSQRAGER